MNKTLLTMAIASAMLATAGIASAQTTTTTTTTWSTDQGTMIRDYSTTKKYTSFTDPNVKLGIGQPVPGTVELYPLPDTVKVESSERYSYGIINDKPVVVERTTRKVVHTFD